MGLTEDTNCRNDCSEMSNFPLWSSTPDKTYILALRLTALILLVAALMMHLRSLRVFRWEQSVSGGTLITCLLSEIGMALCTGADTCKCKVFEAYLCGVCGAILLINGATILHRWYSAEDSTRAMAEILYMVGVQLKRQLMIKVCLCVLAAILMFLDLAIILIALHNKKK